MSLWSRHALFEKNSIILLIGILIVIAIGGLVEIVPLFYLRSTIEAVAGVRPYTPLELAGRNIYVREGCYLCHSQMIRPLRDEVERYGHYSLAAESMYDRPFQWGSKRTGPDLARVGNKYSDDWHRDHLRDPRSVVPGSTVTALTSSVSGATLVTSVRRWLRAPPLARRATSAASARSMGRSRYFFIRSCIRARSASSTGRSVTTPRSSISHRASCAFQEKLRRYMASVRAGQTVPSGSSSSRRVATQRS